MKIFGKIITIKDSPENHGKNIANRNREAFKFLVEIGFPAGRVRKSLFDMNGMSIARLAEGVAVPTLYQTIRGRSENKESQVIAANALGIDPEELFPRHSAGGE